MTYAFTQDHGADDSFYRSVTGWMRQQGANPIGMLSTWMSESGVRALAHNPNGHASGLNQLMPPIAKGLGWDVDDCDPPPATGRIPLERYRMLTALQQSDWVRRYYSSYTGKLKTAQLCYLATFLPMYLARPADELTDDFVLAEKGGHLGWAYAANMVFDHNGDGRITLGELGEAIARNCHGARWEEIQSREAAVLGTPLPAPAAMPEPYDLRTVRGLEEALQLLKNPMTRRPFYAGPIDGIPGPLLRVGVMSFQTNNGLTADGLPGPNTRGSIMQALAAIQP